MSVRALATDVEAGAEIPVAAGKGRPVVNHILIFLAVLAVWQLCSYLGWADDLTLPPPSSIIRSLVTIYITQGNIWWNLLVTLSEALAGLAVGASVGMGLAIAAGLSARFRRYLKPYIVFIQVTPRVAIAPIIIVALGFGWAPKIAIAAMVCFFAPFVNTLSGMLSIDEEAEELFASLGARKSQVFWKLMLPNAMPIIMAGLKLAAASAFAGAIVGEYVAASEGVGVLILRYTHALNMPSAFASLLTLSVTGFLLFRIMEAADHYLVFWRHDDRMEAVSRQRARKWKTT